MQKYLGVAVLFFALLVPCLLFLQTSTCKISQVLSGCSVIPEPVGLIGIDIPDLIDQVYRFQLVQQAVEYPFVGVGVFCILVEFHSYYCCC